MTRFLVAVVAVAALSLSACGSSSTNDPTGTTNGACMDSSGMQCSEYAVPGAGVDFWKSQCEQAHGTWSGSCASGFVGTCKLADGIAAVHYYNVDATLLQQFGAGCTSAGGTWTTP